MERIMYKLGRHIDHGEGNIDYEMLPELFETEELALSALKRKRTTPLHPQYDLYLVALDKWDEEITSRRLYFKTNIDGVTYDPEPLYDYSV